MDGPMTWQKRSFTTILGLIRYRNKPLALSEALRIRLNEESLNHLPDAISFSSDEPVSACSRTVPFPRGHDMPLLGFRSE